MKPIHLHALNGLSLCLACLTLTACDTAPTQVDQHFGLAVRQAQTQQTRNPEARPCPGGQADMGCTRTAPHHPPENRHGPMHPGMSPQMPHKSHGPMAMPPGMAERHHPASVDTDGASAQAAIDRYQESFQTPPTPTPIFNIGVGTKSSR